LLFGSRGRKAFGILMYHRIVDRIPGVPVPSWNVAPRRFRAQMEGLLALGYEPWPLRKVLEHSRARRPIPRKAFVVTFDDGYGSVYHRAWPVLKELQIPATIFVITGRLDSESPLPDDDWAAAGSHEVPADAWRPLSCAQCKEMFQAGLIDLGTHTHTHGDFRGHPDDLFRELRMSRAILRNLFGITDATFAYPFGIAGPELAGAARRAGVLCGLTVESRLVKPKHDRFHWGRFEVKEDDTATTLAAKLDGWYIRPGTLFGRAEAACSGIN
jgi:peptidoglycan/xylan/chitin deacetylase (PgdA/CDA1 family)